MRYFWSLIAALVLVTAGLNTARRSGGSSSPGASSGDAQPAQTLARAERPRTPEPEAITAPKPEPEPEATEPAPELELEITFEPDQPGVDPVSEPAVEVATEPTPQPAPASGKSLDALLGVIAEAEESLPPVEATQPRSQNEAQTQTEPQPVARTAAEEPAAAVVDPMMEAAANAGEQAADGPVGPAFSVRGDGSIEVEGAGVIAGDGSPQRPFVIDWQVLRSVARDYNPKQGQDQIPAWVTELDGKVVRVEGNTLLPVVAASTDELLVMQNPWDGCCVGVPPTPYDAIEVKLAEMTRMGNSPTGFGMVEGTLKVDPYIVQGWLLGLYVIENASFESAAGMTLPGL